MFDDILKPLNEACELLREVDFPSETNIDLLKDVSTNTEKKKIPDDEDWKYYPTTDELFEHPEKAPNMIEQIRITIHKHSSHGPMPQNKNKRGRPEVEKDTSPKALKAVMLGWEKELIRRLSRDQRSDAFFASAGRYIKKIPDIFLKYIGSKCQYKSRDMRVVLRSYLKTFITGFLPMFPLCSRDNNLRGFLDIFLDFCMLSFPDAKWQILLKELLNEGGITMEEYKKKDMWWKIRIKASKLSYRELYDNNNCFQLIWAKLRNHLEILDGHNLNRIENVLKFFNINKDVYDIVDDE